MIEKAIPIPPSKPARSEMGRLAKQMQAGESVVVDTPSQRDTLRSLIYRVGGKVVTRKVQGGYRVWRTE